MKDKTAMPDQRGSTLTETLLAIVIIGIVQVPLFTALRTGDSIRIRAMHKANAARLSLNVGEAMKDRALRGVAVQDTSFRQSFGPSTYTVGVRRIHGDLEGGPAPGLQEYEISIYLNERDLIGTFTISQGSFY